MNWGELFNDRKNKIPIKIFAGKRSGIRIYLEFRVILSIFPNQGHGVGQHVQPFVSTVQEKIRGEMDMADEEEEMLDLLSMQLHLGEGNRPWMVVLAHQHPDAFLLQLLQLCSCFWNLRRGREGDAEVSKPVCCFLLRTPRGPVQSLMASIRS